MKNYLNTVLATLLFATLIGFTACDDSSTDPNDDDNSGGKTALASNNKLVSPEMEYNLTEISLFHQSFVNEVWIFLYADDDSESGFVVKIPYPLPEGNSGEYSYATSLLGFEGAEFSMSSLEVWGDTAPHEWLGAGNIAEIYTKGTLYYSNNSNGTMSFWTNDLELSESVKKESAKRKFSFKFTFENPDGLLVENQQKFGKLASDK